MRNLILSSLIILFGLSAKADMGIKETYMEILGIVKLYCKPDQYFYPDSIKLIRKSMEYPVIGACETDNHTFFNIYIDTKFWKGASKDTQFNLMTHEMSHCLFFRNHVDNPLNFLYYAINRDLTKEEVTQQLIANLNEDCKR